MLLRLAMFMESRAACDGWTEVLLRVLSESMAGNQSKAYPGRASVQ